MSSILESFPKHLTPRQVQRDTLASLERHWDKADVFVVNLPVAAGKSAIAMTVAKWQKHAAIITPSNILVDQYVKEYPKTARLYGKDKYFCEEEKYDKCQDRLRDCGRLCTECPYKKDIRKIHSRYTTSHVTNYHLYMAKIAELRKRVLIVDEAHNLVSFLQNLHSYKIWRHKFNYPRTVRTRRDIKQWLDTLPEADLQVGPLARLRTELTGPVPKYIIERAECEYGPKRELRDCLKLCPIDVRDEPPYLWPRGVDKIVLMSATIGPPDIKIMGLGDKKVIYIDAGSPIPASRRPVEFSDIGSMAYSNQDKMLPQLAEFIKQKLEEHSDEKGFIHITYPLAKKLRSYLSDSRLLWHDNLDKTDVFNIFRNSDQPLVMVASGLYEGVDLAGDLGRWQVISKIPWPSLAEPAVKYLCSKNSKWYAWETVKLVLQACGRICRSPGDYGITYITDSTFGRLYSDNPEMFPEWFRKSVHTRDEGGGRDVRTRETAGSVGFPAAAQGGK